MKEKISRIARLESTTTQSNRYLTSPRRSLPRHDKARRKHRHPIRHLWKRYPKARHRQRRRRPGIVIAEALMVIIAIIVVVLLLLAVIVAIIISITTTTMLAKTGGLVKVWVP